MIIEVLLSIACLTFGLLILKYAAGTLSFGKINVINTAVYLYIIQIYLGSLFFMLGYRNHYTTRMLLWPNESSIKAIVTANLVLVLWPLLMYLFLRLFRIRPVVDYQNYLSKSSKYSSHGITLTIISFFSIISVSLLIVLLQKIGYVPILKLFRPDTGIDLLIERYKINSLFVIHPIVKNLGVLFLIPLLSYITFSLALNTRRKIWIVYALVLFVASIVTKTYNYEKVPIVFHLATYVIIFIYSRGGIKLLTMGLFFLGGIVLLFITYASMGFSFQLSLENGVFARMIATPFGMLALHFDLFPSMFNFLGGRSAPGVLLDLTGIGRENRIRSGRLLMEFYGSEGVFNESAGVMSAVFPGEAYANYGYFGIVLSVIWVSLFFSAVFYAMLRLRKTPVTIALFAYLTIGMALSSQGGFFEFVYNVQWIIVALILGIVELSHRIDGHFTHQE